MKKLAYLTVLVLLISCRTGLDLVGSNYYVEEEKGKRTKIPLKSYSLSSFDTYVFNICEKLDISLSEQRFCECPENFYDLQDIDNIIKVEELYLLKHKTTDLVIYLTTFSHKNIRESEGFLNDSLYYKNNIVLDQLETAYIGKLDEKSGIIHFPSLNKEKDMILHYEQEQYPKRLLFIRANIATAENDYSITQPFSLSEVFGQPFLYKKKNYSLNYYHGKNNMGSIDPKRVDSIKLFMKKGKFELAFSFDNFNKDYKMAQKRIRYLPNFYLIQEN